MLLGDRAESLGRQGEANAAEGLGVQRDRNLAVQVVLDQQIVGPFQAERCWIDSRRYYCVIQGQS